MCKWNLLILRNLNLNIKWKLSPLWDHDGLTCWILVFCSKQKRRNIFNSVWIGIIPIVLEDHVICNSICRSTGTWKFFKMHSKHTFSVRHVLIWTVLNKCKRKRICQKNVFSYEIACKILFGDRAQQFDNCWSYILCLLLSIFIQRTRKKRKKNKHLEHKFK